MATRTLVIGDIHGAYEPLIQCLERSKFDYSNDTLIVLGDICDGWHETPQCIEELMKIPNKIIIWGNHDWWLAKWFKEGWTHPVWESQGGQATKNSYIRNGDLLVTHRHFFDVANVAYVDEENRLFVHGGIPPHIINRPLHKQDMNDLMWDRDLFKYARLKHFVKPDYKWGDYNTIFIGHTSTAGVKNDEPIKVCNVWNLDQGAGWNGKLTIMDVDTEEYWQSDSVKDIYTNVRGRA